MSPEEVIFAVSELLLPERREQALRRLAAAGLLSEKSERALAKTLAKPSYNHRAMARHIVGAKLALDDFVARNRFCVLSPAKALQQVPRQFGLLDELPGAPRIDTAWLSSRTVLEFGSGRKNTLNNGIILYANGAERVFLLEPAPVDWPITMASARMLAAEILFDPARFNVTGGSNTDLKRRVASLEFDAVPGLAAGAPKSIDLGPIRFFTSIDLIPDGAVDLVLSSSVLEHVVDLPGEIARLNRVCRADAVGIHTVDYSTHSKLQQHKEPFDFYYIDSKLNEHRPKDIRKFFEDAGHDVQECGMRDADASVIDQARLKPRFKNYRLEDLLRLQGTFFTRRVRM